MIRLPPKARLASLRWLIPLILLAIAAIHTAVTLLYVMPAMDVQIERRARQELTQRVAAMQGTLEIFLRLGNIDGVRREIAASSTFAPQKWLMLTDESDRVTAATDFRWLERPLSESGQSFDPQILAQLHSDHGPGVLLQRQAGSLIGYGRVNLGTRSTEVRPYRNGVLILSIDLGLLQQEARRQESWYLSSLTLLILGGILVAGGAFHLLLTRRVAKLLAMAHKLAEGDMEARSHVTGGDEIGTLGAAFDQMALLLQYRLLQIQDSETRFRALFENSPAALWEEDFSGARVLIDRLRQKGVQDIDLYLSTHPDFVAECARAVRVIAVNRAAQVLHHASSREELLSSLPRTFSENSYIAFRKQLVAVSLGQTRLESETEALTLDGDARNIMLQWSTADGHEQSYSRVMVSLVDITQHKAALARIEFLAHHDPLTSLPNRLLLEDRFSQAQSFADRSHTMTALLFLDLDHFKRVNDTVGHSAGDNLLKEMAQRLLGCLRDVDTVSRHGGDEFVIVLTEIPDTEAVAAIADKILEMLAQPFAIEGREILISISLGIAVAPNDGTNFDELLKRADLAMYHAKDAGRNTFRFYSERMNVQSLASVTLRAGLKHALERDEFELYYQPQIDLITGQITGAEALLRWNTPDGSLGMPGQFIPVAEESGLILPIGAWVLKQACREAARWTQAGLSDLTVAVNLSALQFRRGNLEETVTTALSESGLDPALLELELTESIFIEDTENVMDIVSRLNAQGIRFSIDDFGTGYSSLSYLKRFAFDKLKIDQSFVRHLHTDPEDAALVRAIIQMARSLNLQIIAEGVEDEHAANFLRLQHCDLAQGYLFARPLPASDFLSFAQSNRLALAQPDLIQLGLAQGQSEAV